MTLFSSIVFAHIPENPNIHRNHPNTSTDNDLSKLCVVTKYCCYYMLPLEFDVDGDANTIDAIAIDERKKKLKAKLREMIIK